ncbi:MAG: 23S rRNA (uracil(1939)-C(5))-methyltransferase RlmD, partial [Clostridia bacterium]|nr:23S rRNA (uracil(1939)-C(5))-methyltransferase RlmD [Clostridia bacterium]
MNKEQIITLAITDLNNLGCGVGRYEPEGKVVFVKGAVTGDTVRAKVIKVNRSFGVAKLLEVVTASPYRLEKDPCEAPLACGGCVYRHITYEHELSIKREYVKNAFVKAGLRDAEVLPVLSLNETEGYRNKGQYPLTMTKEGIRAGFYATGTHTIIPCGDCRIQSRSFAPCVDWICRFGTGAGWTVYDEKTGKGLLRHIYLRRGEKTEQTMVCLVLNGEGLPREKEFSEELTRTFPEVVGVLINVNRENTNVVLGKDFRLLWGRDFLEDELCGLSFRISADSFYQVNRRGAELLYTKATELADLQGDELLVDLYCGTGTIGLSMAKKAEKLIGVELVAAAVECAKENAVRNGIANAEFFCGDASSRELILRCTGGRVPDVVVIDPPRKGSTPELVSCLAELGVAKVVYVSCNPDTLARDAVWFREAGYTVGQVQPVDMFPRTGHVESVCLLSKLNTKQHIEINLDMDELDLTDAEKKATYQEIKDYVLKYSGLKVSSLYIAQVKQKCGIIERENYNKPKSEDAKQPQCP